MGSVNLKHNIMAMTMRLRALETQGQKQCLRSLADRQTGILVHSVAFHVFGHAQATLAGQATRINRNPRFDQNGKGRLSWSHRE